MTNDEMKAAQKRMREIERETGKIAGIAASMTVSELFLCEKMVEEYRELEAKLAAAKEGQQS